jgi:hypothetical protein
VKAKLQKQLAYKYKEKRQYKYVIPEEAVDELGWKGRRELNPSVKEGKLAFCCFSNGNVAVDKLENTIVTLREGVNW